MAKIFLKAWKFFKRMGPVLNAWRLFQLFEFLRDHFDDLL